METVVSSYPKPCPPLNESDNEIPPVLDAIIPILPTNTTLGVAAPAYVGHGSHGIRAKVDAIQIRVNICHAFIFQYIHEFHLLRLAKTTLTLRWQARETMAVHARHSEAGVAGRVVPEPPCRSIAKGIRRDERRGWTKPIRDRCGRWQRPLSLHVMLRWQRGNGKGRGRNTLMLLRHRTHRHGWLR
jgi:hypothetical protein